MICICMYSKYGKDGVLHKMNKVGLYKQNA